jgi:hypothetical protein
MLEFSWWRDHRPEDGGSEHLWNIGKHLRDLRRNILEDTYLHIHRRENLKSHLFVINETNTRFKHKVSFYVPLKGFTFLFLNKLQLKEQISWGRAWPEEYQLKCSMQFPKLSGRIQAFRSNEVFHARVEQTTHLMHGWAAPPPVAL